MVFDGYFSRRRRADVEQGRVQIELDPATLELGPVTIVAPVVVDELPDIARAALHALTTHSVAARAAAVDEALALAAKQHGVKDRLMGAARRHETEARHVVTGERFRGTAPGGVTVIVDGTLAFHDVEIDATAEPSVALRALGPAWRQALDQALARWVEVATGALERAPGDVTGDAGARDG